jgi:hypothetical protein
MFFRWVLGIWQLEGCDFKSRGVTWLGFEYFALALGREVATELDVGNSFEYCLG